MPPVFVYKCVKCGTFLESHIRESLIWSCPQCQEDETLPYAEKHQPMKRVYTAPHMWKVWHGEWSRITGHYETDRKKQDEHLHAHSEKISEEMGLEHRMVVTSQKDIQKNDKGLDATHDKKVEMGVKESKGRFVFPLKD